VGEGDLFYGFKHYPTDLRGSGCPVRRGDLHAPPQQESRLTHKKNG
jgi:hypothetical protein